MYLHALSEGFPLVALYHITTTTQIVQLLNVEKIVIDLEKK
jgi:hypothetical protein